MDETVNTNTTTNNNNVIKTSNSGLSNNISYNERVHYYKEALKPSLIDLTIVQHLSEQGLPESHGLRSVYWKILLRYLPLDQSKWSSYLITSRKGYQDFVDELMIDPYKIEKQRQEEQKAHQDHPLNISNDSKWNEYFKDQALLVDIEKDVRRTFPSLHFFNCSTEEGKNSIHYEALRRILFIYAKLNPGIKYVQGMNEILGPIYYIFAIDPDSECKANAESDAFYCFTNLMSEIRDNFCKTLDRSDVGIISSIKKLNRILRENDRELWLDLEEKKLNPQFYSFRWITLLLSQEFELPDVLRLWDSLFSDPSRFDFLYYFCCAMLICVRDQLLNSSFADSLKLLQAYPNNIDFHSIYSTASSIKNKTFKLNTENVLDSGQSYLRLFNPFVSSTSSNNMNGSNNSINNSSNNSINNSNSNNNNSENVQQQQSSPSSLWNYKSLFSKYFDGSSNTK
ncbi:TBC1 domain family member 13 [Tieghemostelium lacteum]|uniref:TBC1 domain family member 13 n=1 Tax=Tieghemostelium lacteum TaxID=361077 RepID=A0A152A684_TIELA|nr:TBC1 domain family member 13 [Tieghemostelium lacteum]|eukprot:KYR01577.1 TBC1 domain family member 13 [Tieghemostelium lacteum]